MSVTPASMLAWCRALIGADPQPKRWLEEKSCDISYDITATIKNAPPGSVLLLENTRKYKLETCLWDKTAEQLPPLADKLAKLANEFAAKVAKVYVHEAFSAGSLDAS